MIKIHFPNINPVGFVIALGAAGFLAACGGGGGGDGGDGGDPPPPDPVQQDAITSYAVTLTAADVASGSDSAGAATAAIEHNETQGLVDITVSLDDLTAESVSLRRGFAGRQGEEVFSLDAGSSADEWVLTDQPLPAPEAADLGDGRLYLLVTTAANPSGAVRGQILPDGIEVFRFDLGPEQVAGGSAAEAAGSAWLTVDENDDDVQVHVATTGLADADGGIVGRAPAGRDGATVGLLGQDSTDPTHWFIEDALLTDEIRTAASAAALYVQLTAPAWPEGAIRGQLLPGEFELVVTDLSSDAVVMGGLASTSVQVAGRAMTTIGDSAFTMNANLYALGNADAVELRQAPSGQNGPLLATFEQDLNNADLWTLDDVPLDPVLRAGFDNRTLYIGVSTPAAPGGAARGQVETAGSAAPADPSAFLVSSTDPANASKLDGLPAKVFFNLNREPLAASVSPGAVSIEASGGDGSFGDANETVLVPSSVTASGNVVEIDLAGIDATEDVYRAVLIGGGSDGIVDTNGIALDGDADGEPGGRFETAFEVEATVVTATLTKIQADIFTPKCATSGCHSGGNPPDGLLLTPGDSYDNIVDVASIQVPNLDRVDPGNPDDSYLVRKVEGTGIVAGRMPLGAAPLSQAEIDLIRQWVTDGALND